MNIHTALLTPLRKFQRDDRYAGVIERERRVAVTTQPYKKKSNKQH